MDDCRRIAALITSYVDGALNAGSRTEVERHVGACPPCRGFLTRERGARDTLRRCADALQSGQPLPPGLQSRCEALMRAQALGGGRSFWRARVLPAGVVALAAAVAVFILLPLATRQSDTVLAAQLAADHVKCFRVFADPSAVADAGEVERLLAGYGWSMHVPASSAADGLRLLGGRWCLYAHGRIPHVLYEVDGQPLSLFRLDGDTRPPAEIDALGHHSRLWRRGSSTYVLLGPSEAAQALARVAAYMEREAQ